MPTTTTTATTTTTELTTTTISSSDTTSATTEAPLVTTVTTIQIADATKTKAPDTGSSATGVTIAAVMAMVTAATACVINIKKKD